MSKKDDDLLLPNLKGRYPFRLATTSFIYPGGWTENVARLGPCFDEIELLFLESGHADSLPDQQIIIELARQAAKFDIRYNVHLPLDICLGARSLAQRQHALDILKRVFSLAKHLPVSTHTLHLVYDEPDTNPEDVQLWQERTHTSLTHLLEWGVPASALSIENIDYPPEWMGPILTDLELPVCLDVGHILIYGFDLKAFLAQWGQRIVIMHLHGAVGDKDHLSLDQLPGEHLKTVLNYLSTFSGVLSLEVFNLNNLQKSVAFFVEKCQISKSK